MLVRVLTRVAGYCFGFKAETSRDVGRITHNRNRYFQYLSLFISGPLAHFAWLLNPFIMLPEEARFGCFCCIKQDNAPLRQRSSASTPERRDPVDCGRYV